MIKNEQGEAKKLARILTGLQRASAIVYAPKNINKKGAGSSVSVKTTPQNRFIELVLDDLLESSGKCASARASDGTKYGFTEWETVIKTAEPYNTYNFSIIPHTKLTLDDINCCLGEA